MKYNDTTTSTWLYSVGGISGGCSAWKKYNIENGYIENCYNTANITIYHNKINATAPQIRVGGITATTNNAIISNCYNSGDITVTSTASDIIKGGIVGESEGAEEILKISNCYNIGKMNQGGYVGGIFGHNKTGSFEIRNCYYLNTCGGDSSKGEIALTEEQMKTATFANILNAYEKYASNIEWTSTYEDRNEYVWVYSKNNYPTLK